MAAEDIIYDGANWSANHRRARARFPDGGNHLVVDGSASWVKIERTYQITTYDTGTHLWYFYQETSTPFPRSTGIITMEARASVTGRAF